MSQEHSPAPPSSQKRGSSKFGAALAGVVILAGVGLVVGDLATPADGAPETLKVQVQADQTLGPLRFPFSAHLSMTISPRDQPNACLFSLGRDGEVLGSPRPLLPGANGASWTATASASALSDAHYGPLWVVAIAGPEGCQASGALLKGSRGAEQPMAVIAEAIAEDNRWAWGSARVYIHDKLP